ncbi:hypothetical protein EVC62_19045 [Salinicola endophyticus]|uniref:DUF4224 domain-containing protein n=1 Tax=Salinicola endophyticus TaxID=1949083 RepID=A0ABY8FNJ1_9GAMM|nr:MULTISPECIES: hypothetical protein [Salinicola]WFF43420.1 hypothetical protein EVC62_19045 [Salinicola endophyticus]
MTLTRQEAAQLLEAGLKPYRVRTSFKEAPPHVSVRVNHDRGAFVRTLPIGICSNRRALIRRIDLLRSEAENRFGIPCARWPQGDEIKAEKRIHL